MNAKEMFEELGYYDYGKCYVLNSLKYTKVLHNGIIYIVFSLNSKQHWIQTIKEGTSTVSYFDIPLLKAIQKQIEELGWE